MNKNIKIRLSLISDGLVTGDGYYFDDLKVTIIDMSTGVPQISSAPAFWLSDPVPNPAENQVKISYRLPQGTNGQFILYDTGGSSVKMFDLSPGSSQVFFSVEDLNPGLYYYRVKGQNGLSGVKKLLVL
jgi:hypothetical protein